MRKNIYQNINQAEIASFKERLNFVLRELKKASGKLPLRDGTLRGLLYEGRLPSIPILIELEKKGINLDYLFFNKGRPLKRNIPKNYEAELKIIIRELLFLVENANNDQIYFKIIETGEVPDDKIEKYLIFFARLLKDTLKALIFDGRLSKLMVTGLYYIGGLGIEILNKNQKIIMPPIRNPKKLIENYPPQSHKPPEFILSTAWETVDKLIKQAYLQLSQLLLDDNLPEYCWGHNQFYWCECTECKESKEANFSFRKDFYEFPN